MSESSSNKSQVGNTHTRANIIARHAARAGDWSAVEKCSLELLSENNQNPEGWFLAGLVEKAKGRPQEAITAFSTTIQLDATRYDAGIELAWIYWSQLRHREAMELLERFEPQLRNSPIYLEMAANAWTRLGLHGRALPLLRRANELQPDVERFKAELAASAVLCGHIDDARAIYAELLEKHPDHQRNHYQLSRLGRAEDSRHVEQMKAVLHAKKLPPRQNIFLYYAIAKELEDLGRWDESFEYYRRGGDAAAQGAREAGYTVDRDVELINRIIETCTPEWLSSGAYDTRNASANRTPIFIVGLPRTGTTLAERIVGSHSLVESADETFFLQIAIRQASGAKGGNELSAASIEAAARQDIGVIGRSYLESVAYRLTGKPFFIDKYPFNFLYLGFIARAFPDARIVHLRRNPMDSCFAMYKQSFFRFAYTLDDLARYYIAYDRLSRHWREHLTDRIIEVEYEKLVADPDARIRQLLDRLGLEFEQSCVDFHLNPAPSATASTVQVRERAHTLSVARWRKFERHLQPLRAQLEAAGIATD